MGVGFASLFYFVCNILFFLNPVDGLAGSLENLQNEVGNESGYKKELEDYMTSHNASFGVKDGKTLNFGDFDASEMEEAVKSHMEYCKTSNATERANSLISGYEWALVLNDKMILANC
jgi:hypothetical protein